MNRAARPPELGRQNWAAELGRQSWGGRIRAAELVGTALLDWGLIDWALLVASSGAAQP